MRIPVKPITEQAGGLFRAEDNQESVYAKAALRLLYLALARDGVDGWTLERFETATDLSLPTPDGAVRDDPPPMSRFLNRLLALPIDDQNPLFAALEVRIAVKVAAAVEGGVYEQGVETVRADSLVLESREAVFVHDASGAATELCAIVRRDRLHPLAAEEALRMQSEALAAGRHARLMANPRSGRAALVVSAPARMRDDGGVDERVRLVRPALRDTMAGEALATLHRVPPVAGLRAPPPPVGPAVHRLNRPGFPEGGLLESSGYRRLSQLVVVVCLECSRRHMPEGSEQAPVVVPVHPLEGGELHRLAVTPRAAPGDEFGLVQPDDGLGQGVVVEPAPECLYRGSRPRCPPRARCPSVRGARCSAARGAPVGVVDEPITGRTALMKGLFEGIEGQVRVQ